jgi:polysaccharide deacetylase family protein (PEP-CTERM system associated)
MCYLRITMAPAPGRFESSSRPRAILTLDVEDWEHANFAQLEDRADRIRAEARARAYRMDRNVDRWIEELGHAGATSTCFVLGEFARRYPDAVRRLAAHGHEIATHGDTHDLVYRMDPRRFREFLRRGIAALGDLTGRAPIGFRAPSWSVSAQATPWLCAELGTQGIRYDSSQFPVRTPLFGDRLAPLGPHETDGVLRIPATMFAVTGLRLPFASGAFFRLCPLSLLRAGLRRATRSGLPAMVVLHPRELDPEHPRLPLRGWEAQVHYARLASTLPKLRALLSDHPWRSVREVFALG